MSLPTLTHEYLGELRRRLEYITVVSKHAYETHKTRHPFISEVTVETIADLVKERTRLELEVAALTDFLEG